MSSEFHDAVQELYGLTWVKVPPRPRPGWDAWFLEGAQWVSRRADCSRRKVGALIVKDNRLVAQGYNGTFPGKPGCLDGACPRANSGVAPGSQYDHGPGSCIACHAEISALLYSARYGIPVNGCTMYINTAPCDTCDRLIQHAGIVRTVWPEGEKIYDKEKI